LGVAERLLVAPELQEVHSDARANEGVPSATFPVVSCVRAWSSPPPAGA
jgi:hypothetical protein